MRVEYAENIKHVADMTPAEIDTAADQISTAIRAFFDDGQLAEGLNILMRLDLLSHLEMLAQTFEDARHKDFEFTVDQCRRLKNRRKAFELLHKLSAKIIKNPGIVAELDQYSKATNKLKFADQVYNDFAMFSLWFVYIAGTTQQRNEYMDYKQRRAIEKRRALADIWFGHLFVSMSAMLSMCDRIFEPTVKAADDAAKKEAEKRRLEKMRKMLFKPLAQRFEGWEDAKAYEEETAEGYADEGFCANAFADLAKGKKAKKVKKKL